MGTQVIFDIGNRIAISIRNTVIALLKSHIA
jgi:hypothetical protein